MRLPKTSQAMSQSMVAMAVPKKRKMNPPINVYSYNRYFCNINKQNPSCDEKEKNLIFVRYLVCFYLII